MNRRFQLFALTSLTAVVVGCGDTPHVQLRDAITTWNEVADVVYTIPEDPDTADKYGEDLLKGPLDDLKKKWEGVKKRMESFGKLDKEQKVGLEDAIADLRDEARFAIARLAASLGAENDPEAKGERSMGHLGKLRERLVKKLAERAQGEGYQTRIGKKSDLAGWAAQVGEKAKILDPDELYPSFKKISDMLKTFQLELPQSAKNAAKYGVWWNYNRYQEPKLPPPPPEEKKDGDPNPNPGGNPPMPMPMPMP
jgi:hypothetical protein